MSLLNDTLRNLERRNAGEPLPHAAAPPAGRRIRARRRWLIPVAGGILLALAVSTGLHSLVPQGPGDSGQSSPGRSDGSSSPGLPWTTVPGDRLARPSLLGPLDALGDPPPVTELSAPEPLRVATSEPPTTPTHARAPEPASTRERQPTPDEDGVTTDEPGADAAATVAPDTAANGADTAVDPPVAPTGTTGTHTSEPLTTAPEVPSPDIQRRAATAAEQTATLYRRARELQAQRQWERSAGLLEQALGHDPSHSPSRLALADALTRLGRDTAAAGALDAGLAHTPDAAGLVRARARLHLRQQDPEAALRLLERLSAGDREPATRALLARALQRTNQHAEASRHYRELLQDDPSGRHWLALAHSLEHLGQPGEARAAYRRALDRGDLGPASRQHAETRHQRLSGLR
ncbi:MAG: tetratricopeptide repeat protein [Pseudomonadota bacterium]